MKLTRLLCVTLIYIILQTSAFKVQTSLLNSSNTSLLSRGSPTPSQLSFSSKVEIDLDSCVCMQKTEECEIAITRSIFMTIKNCPTDFAFCCSGRLKQIPNYPVQQPSDLSSDPNSFLINTEEEDDVDDDDDEDNEDPSDSSVESIDINKQTLSTVPSTSTTTTNAPYIYTADKAFLFPPPTFSRNKTKRPTRRCTCKPRPECPEEYKDYSFGFGCSHNTVRCCEPIDLDNNTRLIIITTTPTPPPPSGDETPDLEDDDDDEQFTSDLMNIGTTTSDPQCFCLPPEDCERIKENVVWRREDTLCPHNLVKCCGSRNLRGDFQQQFPEEKVDDAAFEGQGGFHQPITLPELKIPMTEEYSDGDDDSNSDSSKSSVPSTLPPPELPTYYNYQPPKYYAGYYNPGFRHESRPYPSISGLPWPQRYDEDSSGYVKGVSSTSDNSQGQNVEAKDSGRRLNSEPSLFDKIAGFLG